MKKRFTVTLIVTAFLLISVFPIIFANGAEGESGVIRLYINGAEKKPTKPPINVNGYNLLPLRFIAESFNCSVGYNAETRIATVRKNAIYITLNVLTGEATVNGKIVKLEAPPVVIDGTTMVPLRFIAESLGLKIDWNASALIISVTTQPAATRALNSVSAPPSVSAALKTSSSVEMSEWTAAAPENRGGAPRATVQSRWTMPPSFNVTTATSHTTTYTTIYQPPTKTATITRTPTVTPITSATVTYSPSASTTTATTLISTSASTATIATTPSASATPTTPSATPSASTTPSASPTIPEYDIGENIIFEDGTEIKITDIYKTRFYNNGDEEPGFREIRNGEMGFIIKAEVLSTATPYSGRYLNPSSLFDALKTDDGINYRGETILNGRNLLPNVRSNVELLHSLPDNENIVKLSVRSENSQETAYVRCNPQLRELPEHSADETVTFADGTKIKLLETHALDENEEFNGFPPAAGKVFYIIKAEITASENVFEDYSTPGNCIPQIYFDDGRKHNEVSRTYNWGAFTPNETRIVEIFFEIPKNSVVEKILMCDSAKRNPRLVVVDTTLPAPPTTPSVSTTPSTPPTTPSVSTTPSRPPATPTEPTIPEYDIGDNIVFENGTEIKITDVYKTRFFNNENGGFREAASGEIGIVIEFELLSSVSPNSGRYLEPSRFAGRMLTDDGISYSVSFEQYETKILPNIRSHASLCGFIPDNENITKLDVSNGNLEEISYVRCNPQLRELPEYNADETVTFADGTKIKILEANALDENEEFDGASPASGKVYYIIKAEITASENVFEGYSDPSNYIPYIYFDNGSRFNERARTYNWDTFAPNETRVSELFLEIPINSVVGKILVCDSFAQNPSFVILE